MTPRQTAHAGAVALFGLLALSGCVLTPGGPPTASRDDACHEVVLAVCHRREACGTQDSTQCRLEWRYRCPIAPAYLPAGDTRTVRVCADAILGASCLVQRKPVECEALTGLDWKL